MTEPQATLPAVGSASPREYRTLDMWRGLAALWVVLFHATADWRNATASRTGASWWLDLFSQHGWLGVQLFFVISGYCIAATADSCRRKEHGVALYCRRRFVRIFPTYIVWLLLLTLALVAAEWLFPDAAMWSRKSHFAAISRMHPVEWLSNLALVQTWLPPLFGLNAVNVTAVGWTLCYEIQFYAIVGAAIAIAPRRLFETCAVLTVALLLLFWWLPGSGWTRPVNGTFLDGRWIQFATGIAVYYALVYATPAGWRFLLGLLAALAIVCLWQSGYALTGTLPARDKRVFELGFCAAFAALLMLLKPIDSQLSQRKMVSLLSGVGIGSYSLYLVHWPICKLLSTVAWKFGARSTAATWCITVPVCVALSLVAAVVYFRVVERRFINAPLRSSRVEALMPESTATSACPDPSGA